AGEADRAGAVYQASDRGSDGGEPGRSGSGPPGDGLLDARWVSLGVAGDEYTAMADLYESSVDGDFDDFAGQPPGRQVVVGGGADAAVDADPTGDCRRQRLTHRGGLYCWLDDLELRAGAGQPEPFDGGSVTEGLVVALGVVFLDPGVQTSLGFVDGGEGVEVAELAQHRLVEPVHPACRGRRVGGGQQVTDAVVVADPVERHRTGAGPEAGREHLAVVRQDGLRDAVTLQRAEQGVADRAGGGPAHQCGDDTEPGMIV